MQLGYYERVRMVALFLFLFLCKYVAHIQVTSISRATEPVVRSGQNALVGQCSLTALSGLVFYYCVRKGIQEDVGPGEERELID